MFIFFFMPITSAGFPGVLVDLFKMMLYASLRRDMRNAVKHAQYVGVVNSEWPLASHEETPDNGSDESLELTHANSWLNGSCTNFTYFPLVYFFSLPFFLQALFCELRFLNQERLRLDILLQFL